jgi:EAL domain-containing protein (putative c-di-GMP-specific phosphodiesterase class I)/PAS domain-containing protein
MRIPSFPSPQQHVSTTAWAAAVVVTAVLIVLTIVFTEFDLHWVTFLSGILIASSLALASRAASADRALQSHSSRLQEVQDQLAVEASRREALEHSMAASGGRLELLDNDLPIAIAFVDRGGVYRYHNRAFRERLRLKAEQLAGVLMRDVLGGRAYGEVAAQVRKALSGEPVRFSRAHGGEVWYLPTFGKSRAVDGFFEISSGGDSPQAGEPAAPEAAGSADTGQDLYVETFSETVTGRANASDLIVAAIEKDEFSLLCQTVVPLAPRAHPVNHFEIFVRLLEEEDSLIPPGAFFPLAEKFGLLPRLDRWVAKHVVEWASHRASTSAWSPDSIFFINIARSTLGDPMFPDFVAAQLKAGDVPGRSLCFEVSELDAAAERADLGRFAAEIRRAGCLLALSGFGRESVSFDVLREIKADFVKIDGTVVLGMLRNNVYLARVASLARVAHAVGIRSVAELVESRDIIEKLREVGVDFAQGMAIAQPVRLRELEARKA